MYGGHWQARRCTCRMNGESTRQRVQLHRRAQPLPRRTPCGWLALGKHKRAEVELCRHCSHAWQRAMRPDHFAVPECRPSAGFAMSYRPGHGGSRRRARFESVEVAPRNLRSGCTPHALPMRARVQQPWRKLLFFWCRWKESNPRPSHYECAALPTELHRRSRKTAQVPGRFPRNHPGKPLIIADLRSIRQPAPHSGGLDESAENRRGYRRQQRGRAVPEDLHADAEQDERRKPHEHARPRRRPARAASGRRSGSRRTWSRRSGSRR